MEAGKRAPKLLLTDVDMDIEEFLRRGVLQTPPICAIWKLENQQKGGVHSTFASDTHDWDKHGIQFHVHSGRRGVLQTHPFCAI